MENNVTRLTIVARIEAKPDQGYFIKQEAMELIEPSRQDDGCIEYRLQADNNNECLFLMFEVWDSQEKLQAHTQTEHFQAFVKNTEGKLASLTISEMTEIA